MTLARGVLHVDTYVFSQKKRLAAAHPHSHFNGAVHSGSGCKLGWIIISLWLLKKQLLLEMKCTVVNGPTLIVISIVRLGVLIVMSPFWKFKLNYTNKLAFLTTVQWSYPLCEDDAMRWQRVRGLGCSSIARRMSHRHLAPEWAGGRIVLFFFRCDYTHLLDKPLPLGGNGAILSNCRNQFNTERNNCSARKFHMWSCYILLLRLD